MLRQKLLLWFEDHGRHFPWRDTRNPFHVLMAEMMLRRTQARQVVPVYKRFLETFPDSDTLAKVDLQVIESILYPLGLAWRVPAFQHLALVLVEEYNGQIPDSYGELLKLPGVGDYVAAAVCCFAFGQAVIIADTNTVRVAGRIFGIPTHAESRRRKPIRELLQQLLDRQYPREFNLALLDLAALICVPGVPRCTECPIVQYCSTGRENLYDGLASNIGS